MKNIIAAGLFGLDGVLHRAADDHDFHAGFFELVHDRHGHAETGNETVRAIVDDDIDRFLKALGGGSKQVDAERLVGQLAYTLHLALNEIRGRAGHAKHAIATGIRHGSGELGV